jgi:integrase/recombinase XerC
MPDLIEDYLAELMAAGRPATTIQLRREQLRHMRRELGKPAAAVTDRDILTWFAHQAWATETRRSYRTAARGFFAWAAKRGHIDTDPAAALPIVHQRPGIPHPVPDDVYELALVAAPARTVLMMRLAAEAGLRRGEIAQVHSHDLLIDMTGGYSLLVHGKGCRDRLIPIPDQLAEPIKAAAGWLFASPRGGHVTPEWVGEQCAAALPNGWTLHALRHRFATRAYAGSHDLRAVQELLGHSSPAITQRYVAVSAADLRMAMLAAAKHSVKLTAAAMLAVALLLGASADSRHCSAGGNRLQIIACQNEYRSSI